MNKMIVLACLACAVSTQVHAGAQQEKMKGCNVEAQGMKGDERKAFMSKCLKKDYVLKSDAAKPAAAPAKAEAKPAAKAEAKPVAAPAAPAKAEAKPAAAPAAPAKAEAKPAAAAPVKAEAKPVATAAAPAKQQDKMKTCNAEAKSKELKGDDRKNFMRTCLKG